MKGDVDDIREKKELYDYFSPMVMKTLKFLRRLLFYEIRKKYIITFDFMYPGTENIVGWFELKRKSRRKFANEDKILVTLGLDSDLSIIGLHFYASVLKKIDIRTSWSYRKISTEPISKNEVFQKVNRILLSLILNLYIDNNLFPKNKKEYARPYGITTSRQK